MYKRNAIRRFKKITIIYCVFLCGSLFVSGGLTANNITVSNASVSYQPTGNKVHFDLNWENSFRVNDTVKWESYSGKVATEHIGVENWDAAWVFVKYRKRTAANNGIWHHAHLKNWGSYKPEDYAIAPGLLKPEMPYNKTTNPILGVFIYRDTLGNGYFERNDVQFALDYNGTDSIDVKVFVVEMVYVPEGAFSLGSGGKEFASFTTNAKMTDPSPWNVPGDIRSEPETQPYYVTSEDSIPIEQKSGSLWAKDYYHNTSGFATHLSIGEPGKLPALFPKGYKGFYCMKYEISQQQYVDFLNTLTLQQAGFLYRYLSQSFGDVIISNGGYYSTNAPYKACPVIYWYGFSAYLDWCGLRPMTELEYEKSCRGVLKPVPEEFAWGNTVAVNNIGCVNKNLINEISTNAGNCKYYSLTDSCVTRVGISATNVTDRRQSGATYYGIMDMSGNASEYVIEVATTKGRAYNGTHGDGELALNGFANADTWPITPYLKPLPLDSADIEGIGRKGGGVYSYVDQLKVSQRNYFTDCLFSSGRGVRNVPVPELPTSDIECGAYVAEGVWKRFMCHNLGAETTYYPFAYDENTIGDLYQWGRLTDGHEKRYSSTTNATASSNIPGHSNFIIESVDWRDDQEDGRWTDLAKASNDPCPAGYKVPSKAQWEGVANETLNPRTAWSNGYSFGDKLFLPAGGSRNYNDASLVGVGSAGGYWSTSVDSSDPDPQELRRSFSLNFTNTDVNAANSQYRATGYSVRCIEDGWPVVTTRYPKDITETTALVGGDVTSEGIVPVTERGICWSTSPNPTIKNKIIVGDGIGGFSTTLTELSTTNTTYYVRAYATNAQGTSYGNQVSVRLCRAQVAAGVWKRFMCHNLGADYTADPFTPSQAINGNYYQWGIKKEVATAYTGAGVISPWNTTIPPEDAWVENGKTVNDPCPDGYRIPTSLEWDSVVTYNTLTHVPSGAGSWGYPGGSTVFGNAIKFGESLLLPAAGMRNVTDGTLAYRGYYGYYCSTSSYYYGSSSYYLNFGFSNTITQCGSINFQAGMSVRCIEAGDMIPTVTTTIPNRTADTETFTGGTVLSDGGQQVTERGVCWSTYSYALPTIANNKVIDANTGIGSFESHIAGINPSSTTYYARAYATNSVGTAYGDLVKIRLCKAKVTSTTWKRFMCHNLGADYSADPFTASKEIIGDYYQWGSKIPVATVNTPAAAIPGWNTTVAPDNSWTSSGLKAANDPCPSGFRVPTPTEWQGVITNNTRTNYGSWTASAIDFTSITKFGDFLWLPVGGYRKNYGGLNGVLSNRDASGQYWSSQGSTSEDANYLNFTSSSNNVGLSLRLDGLSVRCIEDTPSNPPTVTTVTPYTITNTTALSGGVITSDGGSPIVEKGILWKNSAYSDPLELGSVGTYVKKIQEGVGTENFISNITGLFYENTYNVRAYAKNLTGTSYGEIKTFTTLGKCWAKISNTEGITFMCHNLGADTNKDPFIPCQEINGNYYRWGDKNPYATAYTPSKEIYGWNADYNARWDAWSDDVKTVNDPCPTGYRIPSKAIWELVSKYNEETKLPLVWNPFKPDQSQFGNAILVGTSLVLPMTGRYDVSGIIGGRGECGFYWTSLSVVGDMCGTCNAWTLFLDNIHHYLMGPRIRSGDSPFYTGDWGMGKYHGNSIRCVKQ